MLLTGAGGIQREISPLAGCAEEIFVSTVGGAEDPHTPALTRHISVQQVINAPDVLASGFVLS